MGTITYHRVSADDCEILAETRISMTIELTGDQPQEIKDKLKLQLVAYFKKATEDNTCISYLAKVNGEIAGIGSVHLREMPGNFYNLSGKWAYVMSMFTLPAFRRKGVCTGILKVLMEDARKEGFNAFELHASTEGKFVYEQNGFQEHKQPTFRRYF
ncbi:MAG: GNAT family N-acetyltransferase [Bacteroidetes bacterium]|nr:GNAT family N-acetyltransferase [Bacteroidota bacterium]